MSEKADMASKVGVAAGECDVTHPEDVTHQDDVTHPETVTQSPGGGETEMSQSEKEKDGQAQAENAAKSPQAEGSAAVSVTGEADSQRGIKVVDDGQGNRLIRSDRCQGAERLPTSLQGDEDTRVNQLGHAGAVALAGRIGWLQGRRRTPRREEKRRPDGPLTG